MKEKIIFSIINWLGPVAYLYCWDVYKSEVISSEKALGHSLTCLVFVGVLTIISLIISYLLIEQRRRPEEKKLQIFRADFSLLIYFLGVFMSVAYLLGFSLAFHEKYIPISNSNSEKHNDLAYNTNWYDEIDETNRQKNSASEKADTKVWNLLFDEGSAKLILSDDAKYQRQASEYEGEKIKTLLKEVKQDIKEGKAEKKDMVDRIKYNNYGQVEEIMKKIRVVGSVRLVVVLIGHSSNKTLGRGSPYENNLTLSKARVENTKLMITNMIQDINMISNIEWLPVARSSEDNYFSGEVPESEEERQCVEVALLQFSNHYTTIQTDSLTAKRYKQNPKLLDFMYFIIYTITTTGYGDIIPVSGYAKFIVSLTNFLEVFFGTIFFNSLLACVLTTSDPLTNQSTEMNKNPENDNINPAIK